MSVIPDSVIHWRREAVKWGIKIEHVSLAVCQSLSCNNRSPQAGWLINGKPFVMVPEAESPNLELGGLASGEDL